MFFMNLNAVSVCNIASTFSDFFVRPAFTVLFLEGLTSCLPQRDLNIVIDLLCFYGILSS